MIGDEPGLLAFVVGSIDVLNYSTAVPTSVVLTRLLP
jgi:hypothetical protein